MSHLTFVETLKHEVGRLRAAHPERDADLVKASALILHGMVLPTDDPSTGQVLSSDGATTYSVNGSCSCPAGQHGKDCRHLHAWKLYQYVARKALAPTTPPPLPEAPASVNVRLQVGGREVQWTLRDSDEGRLAVRLEALLAQYPLPQPAPQASSQGEGWCSKHGLQMTQIHKDGRSWWSHKTQDGQWCKGRK